MNSCRLSSDYNVFGYDPEGFLAHLAALFYGPEWRPRISGPRPYYTGVIQPPRYGPPAFHQRACLPEDFVVCLPPHYFGIPSPPYLSAPQNFHPDFASVLKGLQISILQDQMKSKLLLRFSTRYLTIATYSLFCKGHIYMWLSKEVFWYSHRHNLAWIPFQNL